MRNGNKLSHSFANENSAVSYSWVMAWYSLVSCLHFFIALMKDIAKLDVEDGNFWFGKRP